MSPPISLNPSYVDSIPQFSQWSWHCLYYILDFMWKFKRRPIVPTALNQLLVVELTWLGRTSSPYSSSRVCTSKQFLLNWIRVMQSVGSWISKYEHSYYYFISWNSGFSRASFSWSRKITEIECTYKYNSWQHIAAGGVGLRESSLVGIPKRRLYFVGARPKMAAKRSTDGGRRW